MMNKWSCVTAMLMMSSILMSSKLMAQDVWIDVPAGAFINRTEFLAEKIVLNTQGHTSWRAWAMSPEFKAVSENVFRNTNKPAMTLSSDVLHWRLASIGGQRPPFNGGGVWPGYKWFTTSYQTWFQPTIFSSYAAGSVNFTFKIPSAQFANQAFYAGSYSMQVTHNYGRSYFYAIEFSPETFHVILNVPEFLSWNTRQPGKYVTISNLSTFRNPSGLSIDLGTQQIASSVDFKLWAKASSNLTYTSTKGIGNTKALPVMKLGSSRPEIGAYALSSAWKDYSAGTKNIPVPEGNRTDLPLTVNVATGELKDQFFQAGTYRFLLDFNARSIDNRLADGEQTEVIVKVLPLSEIAVLPGNDVVNFDFNTAEKYKHGESRVIPNQVRISNNETYELYVKSDAAFFNRQGVPSALSSSALQLGVAEHASLIPLSTVAQKLTGGQPVLDKDLTIKYSISPEVASSLLPMEKNTYSINVIFSFTAL